MATGQNAYNLTVTPPADNTVFSSSVIDNNILQPLLNNDVALYTEVKLLETLVKYTPFILMNYPAWSYGSANPNTEGVSFSTRSDGRGYVIALNLDTGPLASLSLHSISVDIELFIDYVIPNQATFNSSGWNAWALCTGGISNDGGSTWADPSPTNINYGVNFGFGDNTFKYIMLAEQLSSPMFPPVGWGDPSVIGNDQSSKPFIVVRHSVRIAYANWAPVAGGGRTIGVNLIPGINNYATAPAQIITVNNLGTLGALNQAPSSYGLGASLLAVGAHLSVADLDILSA